MVSKVQSGTLTSSLLLGTASLITDDLVALERHYDALVREHGYSPSAVHFSSWATIEKRFEILMQGFPDFKHLRILDLGCGVGHLFAFLTKCGFAGEYVGYDISSGMVDLARSRYPSARFEQRDLLSNPPGGDVFDMAVVSGIFNNLVSDNESLIRRVLAVLFGSVRQGVAFNALSHFVQYRDAGLYYHDPVKIFEFCKTELSPRVVLRHDYEIKPGVIPFEFTMYLYKADYSPVKALT